jgi:DNA helicase-2/ATP-dependent DNA helicase PcrA
MSKNKLIISAAGSGKTTHIINRALKIEKENVLITTFTQANEEEIRKSVIKINGFIPANLTIQTWFSLLIQHGVKPYQSYLFKEKVTGLLLVNSQSGVRYYSKKGFPVTYKETDNFKKYYFSKGNKIYSDKLSKFVYKCNKESNGLVVDRISSIYQYIFVDEAQDLAGYDLSVLSQIFKSNSSLTLVCDPRQVTYLTHWESKFKKYQDGKIAEFIENECDKTNVEIDRTTLSKSYRNNSKICNFANKLYPEFDPAKSASNVKTDHDGVFMVKNKDRLNYIKKYNPVQLRWNSRTKNISKSHPVFNFGESKGLSFNRVLIYPTKDMLKWIVNQDTDLNSQTRAKFYVAVTRARYSVGIICDNYPKGLDNNNTIIRYST